MRSVKKSLVLFLLSVVIIAGGCTVNVGKGGTAKTGDGGVWRSDDAGKVWAQKVSVPTTTGKPGSIANVQVRRMVFDPQDYNAVYLVTEGDGIIYTYDGGDNWRQIEALSKAKTRGLAVDPKNKCILYVTVENKLFKSIDCGRTWNNPYFHQNNQTVLTDVAVDYNNSLVIYLAASSGEILKSINGGTSWQQAYKTKGAFLDVVLNPKDSKVIYAATAKNGLYKTIDAGKTWISPSDGLKSYSNANEYKTLLIDKNNPDTVFLVTLYSIFKSIDGGTIWEQVKLLPGSQTVSIFSAALNPKNSNELYYATRSAFLKSSDGGVTWLSTKLPFSKIANRILVNPDKTNVIYVGTVNPTK